jgi:hypothetical protein
MQKISPADAAQLERDGVFRRFETRMMVAVESARRDARRNGRNEIDTILGDEQVAALVAEVLDQASHAGLSWVGLDAASSNSDAPGPKSSAAITVAVQPYIEQGRKEAGTWVGSIIAHVLGVSDDVKRHQCGDCGVSEGELHELGCDMERCPFCGHQLISCDCCCNLLKVDHELTEEQEEQWKRLLIDKGRVRFVVYPNMCARCGVLWPEMFEVPDEEWNQYVEIQQRHKMLCKPCYDQIRTWIITPPDYASYLPPRKKSGAPV